MLLSCWRSIQILEISRAYEIHDLSIFSPISVVSLFFDHNPVNPTLSTFDSSFTDRIPCSPGWSCTCCIDKDDLEL